MNDCDSTRAAAASPSPLDTMYQAWSDFVLAARAVESGYRSRYSAGPHRVAIVWNDDGELVTRSIDDVHEITVQYERTTWESI
jgi:hypothetical protein